MSKIDNDDDDDDNDNDNVNDDDDDFDYGNDDYDVFSCYQRTSRTIGTMGLGADKL